MPIIKIDSNCYTHFTQVRDLINKLFYDEYYQMGMSGGTMILSGTPLYVYDQMMDVWKQYGQPDGQLIEHIIISTSDEEKPYIDINLLYLIAVRICQSICGVQFLFVIHSEADKLHCHLLINNVSFIGGSRLQIDMQYFKEIIQRIFEEFISFAIIRNKNLKYIS